MLPEMDERLDLFEQVMTRMILAPEYRPGSHDGLLIELGAHLGMTAGRVYLGLQSAFRALTSRAPSGTALQLLDHLLETLRKNGTPDDSLVGRIGLLIDPPPVVREPPPAVRDRGHKLSGEWAAPRPGPDMPSGSFDVLRDLEPASEAALRECFAARQDPEVRLRQLLQLRNEVSRIINRRFRRHRALAFTDIVGSTSFYQNYGDEAGQALMERHLELLDRLLPQHEGRLVETTGDGTFTCYPTVEEAAATLMELQRTLTWENFEDPGDRKLRLRAGIHWGAVLEDQELVTGDAVNLCARVTALAREAEIVITRSAFIELPSHRRPLVSPLPPAALKGIEGKVEVLQLHWRDPSLFPRRVLVQETGEQFVLPDQDKVTFGRLATQEDGMKNDIVLTHPDAERRRRVSRWHFTLISHPEGYRIRNLSSRSTKVNGVELPQEGELPVRAGDRVLVADVLTLVFVNDHQVVGESEDALNQTFSG